MNKKYYIIGGATLLLVVLFFVFPGKSSDSSKELEFIKVTRGELVISLKESGFLNAVQEVEIKNECTIQQLSIIHVVENGTYVDQGDLLYELDAAPLEEEKLKRDDTVLQTKIELEDALNALEITKSEVASSVSEATNAIDFAKMDLAKFEKLEKKRRIEDAKADIDTAKDQLKLSEQTYEASVELADQGFETKNKVERDKLDLAAKILQVSSAESKYKALTDYDLIKDELQLKRDLSESISHLERVKKEGESKIQRSEAKVKGVEAKLLSAEQSLARVVKEIEKTKIYSPVTGYALHPRASSRGREPQVIEKGKDVYRNQTMMRIPNMKDMKIDVKIAEHFVSEVKKGQKASISIDSLKDQTFSAVVSDISLLPVAQNYWERAGSQKYEVTIDVDDSELPDDIKPQISATAEIFIDVLQDALFVPVQAIHTIKGEQVVYVRANNEAGYEEKVVEIGKMNTNSVEIRSGIEEGEEVLISEL